MTELLLTGTTVLIVVLVLLKVLNKARHRLQLSRAKHPSLRGHAKISRRVARQVPFYQYTDEQVLNCDGADQQTVALRAQSLSALSHRLNKHFEKANALSARLKSSVSDLQFTEAYRMPFQFRDFGLRHLKCGNFAIASNGVQIQDIDGHWNSRFKRFLRR